jgi:hypothetical protein
MIPASAEFAHQSRQSRCDRRAAAYRAERSVDQGYEAQRSEEIKTRRADCHQYRKRQRGAGRRKSRARPGQDPPGGPTLDPVQPAISVWLGASSRPGRVKVHHDHHY